MHKQLKKYGKDNGEKNLNALAGYLNDNGYKSLGDIVIGIDRGSNDRNMMVIVKDGTLKYVSEYKSLEIREDYMQLRIEEKNKLD